MQTKREVINNVDGRERKKGEEKRVDNHPFLTYLNVSSVNQCHHKELILVEGCVLKGDIQVLLKFKHLTSRVLSQPFPLKKKKKFETFPTILICQSTHLSPAISPIFLLESLKCYQAYCGVGSCVKLKIISAS